MDHYSHRAHRQKYKKGYGVEGADRGKNELPPSPAMSPKEMSYAAADADTGVGVAKKGDHVDGQKGRKRSTYIASQTSKTRPNPY